MKRPFKELSDDDLNQLADRVRQAPAPRTDGDPLLDKLIGEIRSREVLKEAQTIVERIAAETGRPAEEIAEELVARVAPRVKH